jgi:hypothetical protein
LGGRVGGRDLVGIREDGGVVLGAQVGLDSLPFGSAAGENVAPGLVPAHEGEGLERKGRKGGREGGREGGRKKGV